MRDTRVLAAMMAIAIFGMAGCGSGESGTVSESTTTTLAQLTLEQVLVDLQEAGCEAEGAQGRYGGIGQLGLRVYKDQLTSCGVAVEKALSSLGFNEQQMMELSPGTAFESPADADFVTVGDAYRVEMNNFHFLDFIAFVIFDQENSLLE